MILIKFVRKGVHYTWIVNDNWVMLLSFLLTMGIGIIFRRIKNSNKEIKMSNLRGGKFIGLTSALLAGAIAFNVAQDITNFECNNLVSKVTMERGSEGKAIGFLERPPEKNPRVFIKDNEDIEIYFPSLNKNEYCFSESKQKVEKSNVRGAITEPQNQIHRKCEKEFVPLKERTKTLADLRKQDSTENREKAAPYIKRYEDRRKRIMNKRI